MYVPESLDLILLARAGLSEYEWVAIVDNDEGPAEVTGAQRWEHLLAHYADNRSLRVYRRTSDGYVNWYDGRQSAPLRAPWPVAES